MAQKTEGELLSLLQKLAELNNGEGKRVAFKDPITKDNWLMFMDVWLRAADLKYRLDSDGDINVRYANGGSTYKAFDKDYSMYYTHASKISSTADDLFAVGCLVVGDQKVPEKDRDKLIEYLTRATFGGRTGSFGFMQDRIALKMSLIADSKTDGNDVAQSLFQARKMFSNYYNLIPDILDGTLTATQAIEKVEK